MSSRPSVYLAGPILGLQFKEARDWRQYAYQRFNDCGIDAYSPVRGYDMLPEIVMGMGDPTNPMRTANGIVARDRFDVMNRDLVLINFSGAEKVSIGSVIEIGWADAFRKPIIIVMQKGNVHEHAMVTELAPYIVEDLDTAILLACRILIPYP